MVPWVRYPAVAWVIAVVWIPSLAWELPLAMGVAKKEEFKVNGKSLLPRFMLLYCLQAAAPPSSLDNYLR